MTDNEACHCYVSWHEISCNVTWIWRQEIKHIIEHVITCSVTENWGKAMQIRFLLFYFHTFKTKMNEYFKFLNLNCSNEKYIRVLQEKNAWMYVHALFSYCDYRTNITCISIISIRLCLVTREIPFTQYFHIVVNKFNNVSIDRKMSRLICMYVSIHVLFLTNLTTSSQYCGT